MKALYLIIASVTLVIANLMVTTVEAADTTMDKSKEIAQLLQHSKNEGPAIKKTLYLLSANSTVSVDSATKQIIENLFNANANKETILLAGLAHVDAAWPKISFWAGQPITEPKAGRFFGTNEWAANLIAAREGDTSSIKKLLAFAETQDLHTLAVFVLPDLQYVPQPEVVLFLKGYLDGNYRLEAIKRSVPGILVANYAAYSLARLLKGFPLNDREDFSYSEQDIAVCRNWMSQQKQWEFK